MHADMPFAQEGQEFQLSSHMTSSKQGTVVNHTIHKTCSLSDFRRKYPSLRIVLELSHNITPGLSHGMLTLQTRRELIAFPHRPS